MSIERDQDFEQIEDIAAMMAENPGIEFENGKYVYYGLNPATAFAAVYISGAWAGWQAKAQAVPDGFVVVPIDDLARVAQNILELNNGEYYSEEIEENVCTIESMIKAQEPK